MVSGYAVPCVGRCRHRGVVDASGEKSAMTLQEQIQAVMTEQDVTAYSIAEKTGIDRGLLSRFFSGKSALSIKSLEVLLDELGYELSIKKKRKTKKALP